jgi:hypothetical protein
MVASVFSRSHLASDGGIPGFVVFYLAYLIEQKGGFSVGEFYAPPSTREGLTLNINSFDIIPELLIFWTFVF